MQDHAATPDAHDAPPFISHLRLRHTPSAGALAPLLGATPETGGEADAPRRGHHLIWSLFADRADRRRDFLWTANGPGAFVTLSARRPDDRHRLFDIDAAEPFEPLLAAGDRVAFRLHANPVVNQVRDREPRRMSKHDIITNVLRQHPTAERHRRFDEAVQSRGFSWLASQGAAKGFSVEPGEVRIHGYRRHEIARPARRGRRRRDNPRYATLDFEGVLTVTDRAKLLRAIATGFGSSRTWGCGLMLVRTGADAVRTAA
ncbi:MAG: type I-E CRISPR-associated protein Cas6/Cse3/CasE [Acidobacteria bacterium]|nr:type I-E CRISPR-associated protein Cas6/Cse3/CasE [Acidobacteriota bacterium]